MSEEVTSKPALIEGEDFYWEGAAMVFTSRFHLKRGKCCGSGCRHCPFAPKHCAGATRISEGEKIFEKISKRYESG